MRLFLFFQKIFGTRVSASGTPSGLLEPSGTREAPLEQSLRLYLERALAQMELLKPPKRALAQLELLEPPGTRASALGTPPWGIWNRASGSIWNAAGFWPALQRTWNALGLLEPSGTDPQALLPAHWG